MQDHRVTSGGAWPKDSGQVLIAVALLSVVLVVVAMGLALAHALEFPGKRRLTRDEYLVVQPIY